MDKFIAGLIAGVVLATACMVIQAYAEQQEELSIITRVE